MARGRASARPRERYAKNVGIQSVPTVGRTARHLPFWHRHAGADVRPSPTADQDDKVGGRSEYHRTVSIEARLHPRVSLDATADLIGEEVVLGRSVADISLGGCRFSGQGWESVGTEVQMVFSFPNLRVNLPLTGVVVRSTDRDLAVRFHNLSDEQKWALRKHLRDLQNQAGAG